MENGAVNVTFTFADFEKDAKEIGAVNVSFTFTKGILCQTRRLALRLFLMPNETFGAPFTLYSSRLMIGSNMKKVLFATLFMLMVLYYHAATLSVAIDGSQAYTSIQAAIDASEHSDTVLVYPGRYIENVRFNGKNITLASLELTTGDRSYVYSTIIDGNQNGPVVRTTTGESSIHIQGFTITNGSGDYNEAYDMSVGGGIIVTNMSGDRDASIVNCQITGNKATNGGGFWGGVCHLHLQGVSIHDNVASVGGGMQFEGAIATPYSINFDPDNRCSIYNNFAAFGSDLYYYKVNSVHVVVDTFTVANPWNFYVTAVPSNPNISNPYTFDILNTVHNEVNHDLYVAIWGNDSNSGLSPAEPMRSIFMAMYRIASDSENPKTVHVADGHYSPSLNGQLFPLPIKSYTNLIGESREGTILDAENERIFLQISPGSIGWSAEKLSFRNGTGGMGINRASNFSLSEISIENVYSGNYPLGISLDKMSGINELKDVRIRTIGSSSMAAGFFSLQNTGSLKLINVEISDCFSPKLESITISTHNECDILIEGCEVHNNRSTSFDIFDYNSMLQIAPNNDYGTRLRIEIKNSAFFDNYQATSNNMGMAKALNDTLFISNCTFAGNSGGSAVVAVQGTSILRNNIFHNPAITTQVYIPNYISSGIFSPSTFSYNNILGGASGVYNATSQNPLTWGQGNTDVDPIFAGTGNRPYTLGAASPLIDAGWQNYSLMEDSQDAGGNERVWDGDGDGMATIDIGAYEYQPIYSPLQLQAEVWQQQIYLAWQMPDLDRGISGFRLYRNGDLYADILDPNARTFRDFSAENDTLSYYVVALYGTVESSASNLVTVIINCVDIQDADTPAIGKISISPNPFHELAVISYQLPKSSQVELKIYNLKGQLVRQLFNGTQEKGEQILAWEGCDDQRQSVATGIYFLVLTAEGKALGRVKILKL